MVGSLRGPEGNVASRANLPFTGLPSEPLYRLTSARGLRSALKLLKSLRLARETLTEIRPEVVVSTGGYASAPVMQAARKLGIPVIVHEQNTVPGRSNRMMAADAYAFCTVFESTANFVTPRKLIRTGMPIRQELREAALLRDPGKGAPQVLIMGGSQGSAALNDAALAAAVRMTDARFDWVHITGLGHFERSNTTREKLGINGHYQLKSYCDVDELGDILRRTTVAISRSGAGSLAELAAFRIPGILVPYPFAFAQHQRTNAQEFVQMGAATLLEQDNMDSAAIEKVLEEWLESGERRERAQLALQEWDRPSATADIAAIVEEAALARRASLTS